MCLEDLCTWVEVHQTDRTIVVGDFNETIEEGKGLAKFAIDLDLKLVVDKLHITLPVERPMNA